MWVGLDGVGLDAVDWAGLRHNYGSAEDVPELLRRCGGPDPDDAGAASSELLNLLFHQGGWICSAASAALPFVLRLAAAPQVPSRCAMLELVAMLAAEAGRVQDRFLDSGWVPAWTQALPEVLGLLDDADPEIRRATADALGACRSPGELVLPGLLRCWEAEEDPATRLELVLSLGQAALRAPVGEQGAEAVDLLRGCSTPRRFKYAWPRCTRSPRTTPVCPPAGPTACSKRSGTRPSNCGATPVRYRPASWVSTTGPRSCCPAPPPRSPSGRSGSV